MITTFPTISDKIPPLLSQIEEKDGFLVEKRFDDRMVILTPKRTDGNY